MRPTWPISSAWSVPLMIARARSQSSRVALKQSSSAGPVKSPTPLSPRGHALEEDLGGDVEVC